MNIDKIEIKEFYFKEALDSLLKILRIPSEQGKQTKTARFGVHTLEALKFTLNLANKWGLKTYIDPEGYYGFADYGNGDNIFLVAPHLDVVTAANLEKWDNPPFDPIIKDGKIFARGAIDDKGPAYMAFYALKYLVDKKYDPQNYTIRFVFGLDEEKEMRCLKKYVEDFGAPISGFTPDGGFPCIYAEKAVNNVNLIGYSKCDFTIKKAIESEDYNVVVDHIIYQGPNIERITKYLNENKIETKIIENELHVIGAPAHGSLPELGINAGLWILKALDEIKIQHPLVQFCAQNLFNNYDLKNIVGDISDETGSLSTCVGYINVDKNKFKLGINFRIPSTRFDQKDVIAPLELKLEEYGIILQVRNSMPPIYFEQNRSIVKKMVKVYQELTGNIIPPMAIGGGTYAKFVPNLIACGMVDDYSNMSMHQYNEWVEIEKLQSALLIYTHLLVELTS